ncbi:MAG: DUF86 domain-containing protein [Candidatus Methylomirabilis sp.]|nr:DUF86 domain-containing protein [Candidatus Methylomirabilis sp.]
METKAAHPTIPWDQMIAMRHRIAHDYFRHVAGGAAYLGRDTVGEQRETHAGLRLRPSYPLNG